MSSRAWRLTTGVILTLVLGSIITTLLSPTPITLATTREIAPAGSPPPSYDLAAIPQAVVEDASRLSAEIFGTSSEYYSEFLNQLLTMYSAANGKDLVMIFNPGGWGWTPIEDSPHGQSFIDGIGDKLNNTGHSFLVLNHLRTDRNWPGRFVELVEMSSSYPTKAEELATRVNFLTSNIPDIKVIIAGESNGSMICEDTINILKENPRVYSIQLGPPHFTKNPVPDRTLVLKYNGITPDSFSQGDFGTIIISSLESLLNPAGADDTANIGISISAPGHDYRWEYPEVRRQITAFLDDVVDIN